MSDISRYYMHVIRKPGSKIAKRVRDESLTHNNPSGTIAKVIQERAKERNRSRIQK